MWINYIINIILNRIIKYYKKSNKELKNRKGNVINIRTRCFNQSERK